MLTDLLWDRPLYGWVVIIARDPSKSCNAVKLTLALKLSTDGSEPLFVFVLISLVMVKCDSQF